MREKSTGTRREKGVVTITSATGKDKKKKGEAHYMKKN